MNTTEYKEWLKIRCAQSLDCYADDLSGMNIYGVLNDIDAIPGCSVYWGSVEGHGVTAEDVFAD